MKSKLQFIMSMVIFGTIGVFVRNISLSSSKIALLRGLIGSLFLLVAVLSMKRRVPWERIRENAFLLLLSGAALGGNWVFLFQAYKNTTISNATLSYYFAPVFVMLLSPVVLKERLSLKKIVCICAAMLGMLLIMRSGGDGDAGGGHLLGIGYGLAAAALYASLMLINRFIRNLNGLETTLIQLTTASLLLLLYVFFAEGLALPDFSGTLVVFILILGIVHTGVGFFLFFSGMQRLDAQSTATLCYIDPLTALFISVFLLREEMTVLKLLGGALLLGAIFASERKPAPTGTKSNT